MYKTFARWIGDKRLRAVWILFVVLVAETCGKLIPVAAGPVETAQGPYKVLEPIHSGNMTLFPVVRADGKSAPTSPFLTLDEGLRSGEVEVTEAGRVQGLIRTRTGQAPAPSRYQSDQVNTLVLVNHSKQPLLLLAGEVVTGGKQDRVVAKDRIVPPASDPIDLSVFCIEPGRWTESSAQFGASAKDSKESFMVQPKVRQEAMVDKNQQQVWGAVGGAISQMQTATVAASAAPVSGVARTGAGGGAIAGRTMPQGMSSYAKAMQTEAVTAVVDEAAAPLMQSRDQILASLQKEHAVGVVVAMRGEIIWADIFADTDLLTRYWQKLVRSYAADGLGGPAGRYAAVTQTAAQNFLNAPAERTSETSEGETGIYRYNEIKSGGTDLFILESLLPETGYEVHLSKLRLQSRFVTALPMGGIIQ